MKEQQLKEAMERELQEKDKQLQELLQKHQEVQSTTSTTYMYLIAPSYLLYYIYLL